MGFQYSVLGFRWAVLCGFSSKGNLRDDVPTVVEVEGVGDLGAVLGGLFDADAATVGVVGILDLGAVWGDDLGETVAGVPGVGVA